jgi:peptide/nickel transport system permease protein
MNKRVERMSTEASGRPGRIRSLVSGLWRFATRRRTTGLALLILGGLLFIAATGPFIAPYDADELRMTDRLQGPNRTHLLGTDHFGRDILSRALSGTRITLLLGVSISAFALCVGLPIGMLAGFFDRFGLIVMRVVDALMAFPAIILALALMAILGKPGIANVILAVGLVWAPRMVRVVYSATLTLRESVFVEAARALGVKTSRILLRHIAINLISPVIVQATFTFAFSIMEVAALNFLGVGIPPYVASWGGMMNEGRTYVIRAPWIILFPGLFLATAVLSFNLVGDALRDRLDPKLRRIM